MTKANWQQGSDPSGGYLMIGGKRVAAEVVRLKSRGHGAGKEAKPGLRFDKVVMRLMEHLKAFVDEIAPDGVTVLLTVTAPIRLPGKTATVLEEKLQRLLKRGAPDRDDRDTIHGNDVRIRLFNRVSEGTPKLIGFVHNSDADSRLLLNVTGEWVEVMGGAGRRAGPLAGDQWLVVISALGSSWLEAYRYIYSLLPNDTGYKKIAMVFGDGKITTLT